MPGMHAFSIRRYLDCIVKEGLRLCPSVPLIGRRVHEDLVVPVSDDKKYTIPAGTIVYVFIYMLHRDPESFPRPESFDPDRFLLTSEAGNERKNPFAYVPFSAGQSSHPLVPHKCLMIRLTNRTEELHRPEVRVSRSQDRPGLLIA